MSENKVKFGLKNVHVAIATIAADNTATYDTPFAFPGAVSLSMDPQGETTTFRADNIDYWVGQSNHGYEGDLEMARFIDKFKTDILKMYADAKGVLVETVEPDAVHFAMMFEFDGDQKATRHVLYNCTCGRPSVGSSTTEDTVEPQTESATVTAGTIHLAALDKDIVKADTTATTDQTAYDNWYQAVYQPTARNA